MSMRLLLISNSTNFGEGYLEWPKVFIEDFLRDKGVKEVAFIPYAGVGLDPRSLRHSFDAYELKVKEKFNGMGYGLRSVHHEDDPVAMIKDAEAIAVGGGNTFYLVYMLHRTGLMQAIREKAGKGVPYMGWSAGSNVACPTLRTTNDMPSMEPDSFDCMNLVPFQINPHYLDANPEGHGGETRQQRIEEFLTVNRDDIVVGLREGTLLELEGEELMLKGQRPMRLFRFGEEPQEFEPGADINFLLK